MAKISVEPDDGAYLVTVTEGTEVTHHVVEDVDEEARARGVTAERLVEASFRFLLDREPKESILPRFRLSVIGRYFPEYPDDVDRYLREPG